MPSIGRRIFVISIYGVGLFALTLLLLSAIPDTEAGLILIGAGLFEILVALGFIIYFGITGRLIGCRRIPDLRPAPFGFKFRFQNFIGLMCASVIVPATIIVSINIVLFGFGSVYMIISNYAIDLLANSNGLSYSLIVNFFLVPIQVLLGYLAFLYGGIPIARLLLRIAPPKPNGKIRWLAILFACLVGFIIFRIGILYGGLGEFSFVFSLALFSSLGVIFPVVLRQLRPADFLKFPYIIMLRRFSSFSDRLVVSSIFKSKPNEKRIVILTPTHAKTADWNPLTICFTGIRFTSPISSIPIFLRETDVSWQDSVEHYITNASRIVIDISDDTDAIQRELDILTKTDRWTNTLVVAEYSKLESQMKRYNIPGGTEAIGYKKSWLLALPRAALGLVIIIFGSSGLTKVPMLANVLNSETSSINILAILTFLIILPFIFLFFSVYVAFFVTFISPTVSLKSSKLLKKWGKIGEHFDQRSVYNKSLVWGGLLFLLAWYIFRYFIDHSLFYTSTYIILIIVCGVFVYKESGVWVNRIIALMMSMVLINIPHFFSPVRDIFQEQYFFYPVELTPWLISFSILLYLIVVANRNFNGRHAS